jgi:hypothetical protein
VVQLETAQACDAPTASANSRSKSLDLGTLRDPAREDGPPRGLASRSSSQGRATGIRGPADSSRRRSGHPVLHPIVREQFLGRLGLAAIPLEQSPQAVFEADARLIPEQRSRLAHVRVQPPHVAGPIGVMLNRRRLPKTFCTTSASALIDTSAPKPRLMVWPMAASDSPARMMPAAYR